MYTRKLLCLAILLPGFSAQADYFSTVMSFNPVAYWRLDETNRPPTDVATNLGNLGTNGTGFYLSGATHPVPGALAGSTDTAAAFDGFTGRAGVPFNPALSLNPPFTAEAWVQPQQIFDVSDPRAVLCCLDFSNGRSGWVIYQSGVNWNLRLGDTNGYTFSLSGSNIIQTGNWYHLVAVCDGTNATLYVNGVMDLTGPVSSFTPNNIAPFEMGGAAAVERFANTFIDEVAVYTNALSAGDALAHYQNGTNFNRSVPYNQLIAAKNPLLYFRLDEPSFNPGTLPVAVNQGSLGAVANGSYQPAAIAGAPGVPFPGLGPTNRACQFNGFAGFVDAGMDSGLDIQGAVTLIVWIQGNPAPGSFQDVLGKGDSSWRLTVDEDGFPRFADGIDNDDLIGTSVVQDGNWHQLAGVYDGNNFYLYVDGLSDAVAAAPFSIDGSDLSTTIGRAPDYEDRSFRGAIDEASIFSGALTAQQILQIYQSANVPPSIIQSPLSQTVNEGASVILPVTAGGTPPLFYQWSKNTTNLTGQTATTLALNNVQTDDGGSYAVMVTNVYGAVTSSVAVITVLPGPPVVFQQPQPASRYVGGTVAFSVVAHGTEPLFYQWSINGTNISGAASTSYTSTNLQATNAGDYSCTVSNLYGTTNSLSVTLIVIPKPTDPYTSAVLTDNPLGFWRLGETNGTIANDYVGGHAGQYFNAIQGQPGYSLFDTNFATTFGPGYNSYVGDISGIDFSTASANAAFSVEAWVKCPPNQSGNPAPTPFDPPNNDVGIVAKGDGGGGEQFSLDLGSDGSYRFLVRNAAGSAQLANSFIPPDNMWQHVVGVCDEPGGHLHLYINGVEWAVASTSIGILNTSHAVSIGSRQSGNGAYDLNLNGTVDEVALYGYALSPAQVQAHFNAQYGNNRAPAIGTPPAAVTNYVSLPTTLAVEAGGSEPLSYQWKFNGVDIFGAVNSSYTVPSLNPTNAGNYSVIVSNSLGTNQSSAAHLTVLPIPGAVDVSSNLVLHLKLDGDYVDHSGQGNHGTNIGATSFVPGEIGTGALNYTSDGSSSFNYVTLGLKSELQFSSNVNFSIAYWVRVPDADTPMDLPFFCDASSPSFVPGYDFCPGIDLNTFEYNGGWFWTLYDSTGGGALALGAANSINDGNWHHLVHTFDRSGNALSYLDSVLVDSRPIGHLNGPSLGDVDSGLPTNIGQDPTGEYSSVALINLDDVGVWQRVLTPLEAAGMYVVGVSNHVSFGSVPVRMSIQRSANQVRLTWPAGLLQSASQVGGAYTDVPGATSPYVITPAGANQFYRVRQ